MERVFADMLLFGSVERLKVLVSGGYRNAEKALADNYTVGDVVAFRHAYKQFGFERGR